MNDGRRILLVGSGPIQIGQAAEFDYSGAQACRALQEEGAEVILVNSNPATIMTDPEMADRVYIEPITPASIAEVIAAEEPDGVIAGLGGQTGLNVTAELAEQGVLDEYGVEIMGTPLETIYATEDRDRFRDRMERLGQPVPRSETITDLAELDDAVAAVGGLPVIVRTTYTLGGQGSSVVHDREELEERARHGLRLSRNGEVMVTESIDGWVELEYEVMRDADDSCVIICNMENLDPMGIHTGESTVVTPSQVIPDDGHQEMRDAALEVIRDLGIQGGCNIQFAWHDDGTPGGEYRVVEVNPRVSRSSALASKATGYPIARVTAKVALGKRLHEIDNEITGETTAAFEPAIDYVVTKVPRWPVDKFPETEFELSTAMKSTGEAMSIGRTFEESLTKALRSSEYDPAVDLPTVDDATLREEYLERPCPERPYAIFEAFDRGFGVDEVVAATGIHEWYVERFRRIADARTAAGDGSFGDAAAAGLTNDEIAAVADTDTEAVESAVPARSFKQVDTCAGEFAASTPYYYSARQPEYLVDGGAGTVGDTGGDAAGDTQAGATDDAQAGATGDTGTEAADDGTGLVGPAGDELRVDRDAESVLVVGGGPIRIGQGVEFDYCAVHAVQAFRAAGLDAHVVNNNPETVSTDYDTSDGLFFEPLTPEEIADAVAATDADGVAVQFGGQTSVEVGEPLAAEFDRRGLDCEILGTSPEAMDLAEDRDRFNRLLADRGIAQPEGGSAESAAEAVELAAEIGYPVLVRPSYVLGGRAMEIVHDETELREYVAEAVRVSPDRPILIDEFLDDAVELDVDAVADGEDVLIGGIMEHVESAGVHSGDSACVIPPRSLTAATETRVREVVEEIADALDTVGLLNVQLAVEPSADGESAGDVYVLEANPRSSRTVPFVSKATGVPIARLAARVMAGESLAASDATEQIPDAYSVKEVVLPFDRLPDADPRLGPEMKSTGEVMGTHETFGRAYDKAQIAAGAAAPTDGTAVVEIDDDDDLRERFGERFEIHEPADTPAAIREGAVDYLVSDRRASLRAAVDEDVPYVSTVAAAEAVLTGLDSRDADLSTVAVTDRSRRQERWGERGE